MFRFYNTHGGAQDEGAHEHREKWIQEQRSVEATVNRSAFLTGGSLYHNKLNARLEEAYDRLFPVSPQQVHAASVSPLLPRSTPYGPGLNTNKPAKNYNANKSASKPSSYKHTPTLKELMRKKHGTYEEMRAKRWENRCTVPKKFEDVHQFSDHADKWEGEAFDQARRWKEYLPAKSTWKDEYTEFEEFWEDEALKHTKSDANKNWGSSKEWNKPEW